MRVLKFTLSLLALVFTVGCSSTKPHPQQGMPSKEQMEAAWKKASTPTAEHALLRDLAGKWKVTTKFWMMPGSDPEVGKGTSTATMVLDGKFLKEEFSGTFMGQGFKGVGYTGFDTVSSEFNSVWMDSMSTTTMTTTGTYNPTAKTLVFLGNMSCPMSAPEKVRVRSELHLIDSNHHTFTMYGADPQGQEHKSMEINYTRVG